MADYLIDSHIFLWAIDSPARLLAPERELLSNNNVAIAVSVASFWELSIKSSKGLLPLGPGKTSTRADHFAHHAALSGFHVLPVTAADAEYVRYLPFIHRDPFDRLIIAQAVLSGRAIMTRDAVFSRYPGLQLWAP